MDDMSTFERDLAGVIQRAVGPERPVDAIAIARSTTTQSPKWRFQSMFAATKLVVAGAIVALFGGVLLAGVLTQPSDDRLPVVGASASATAQAEPTDTTTVEPDPTTHTDADDTTTGPDLLPGVALVTEEVEPGVHRIVGDGHRELSRPVVGGGYDSSFYQSNIAAGQDGSVWVFGPETFYRLGDPRTHPSDEGTPAGLGRHVEVGSDGVVWAMDRSTLRSFDGTSWEVRAEGVTTFDVALDGTVYAHQGGKFQRLGPDGWATLGPDDDERLVPLIPDEWLPEHDEGDPRFWVSPVIHYPVVHQEPVPGGEVPFTEVEILRWPGSCDPESLHRCMPSINLYGTTSSDSGPAGAMDSADIRLVDMADDGDYWIMQSVEVPVAGQAVDIADLTANIDYLVHVEGGPMTVYTTAEGVPRMVGMYDWGPGWLRAGSDDSVWLTPDGEWCGDGIARFDGQTWTRFLRGVCIYGLDLGPDGTAWVQGGPVDGSETGPVETYAITPEAVAAAE